MPGCGVGRGKLGQAVGREGRLVFGVMAACEGRVSGRVSDVSRAASSSARGRPPRERRAAARTPPRRASRAARPSRHRAEGCLRDMSRTTSWPCPAHAPRSWAVPRCDGQYGVGTMISSPVASRGRVLDMSQRGVGAVTSPPGLHSASTACRIACFAPQQQTTCDGSYLRPFRRSKSSHTAERSSCDPASAVYLTLPSRSASCAASITSGGGEKSGSPTEREMTGLPCRLSSMARSEMATVADAGIAATVREIAISPAGAGGAAPKSSISRRSSEKAAPTGRLRGAAGGGRKVSRRGGEEKRRRTGPSCRSSLRCASRARRRGRTSRGTCPHSSRSEETPFTRAEEAERGRCARVVDELEQRLETLRRDRRRLQLQLGEESAGEVRHELRRGGQRVVSLARQLDHLAA